MAEVIVNPEESSWEVVRNTIQYAYGPALLTAFLIVGALDSIARAKQKQVDSEPTVRGPGGNPLPPTKRNVDEDADDDEQREQPVYSPAARSLFQWLQTVITLTLMAQAVGIALRALHHRLANGQHGWWCGEAKTVMLMAAACLHLYMFFTLADWLTAPSLVHIVFWSLAFVLDAVIFICDAVNLSGKHHVIVQLDPTEYTIEQGLNQWDHFDLSFAGLRIIVLIATITAYCILRHIKRGQEQHNEGHDSNADENTPLLSTAGGGHHTNRNAGGGTNGASEANAPTVAENESFYRSKKLPNTTWYEYAKNYSTFFPYMWPRRQLRLKVVIVLCFIILILQRILNVLVPIQIGTVTNELSGDNLKEGEHIKMPWLSLGLLVVFKLLQGTSGILGSCRTLLWIPVSQHTYQALTTSAFEHVHSLSLDFHLGKRTGEVLSALNKGAAINSFLEQVTFQVIPMIIDLFSAIGFLYIRFNAVYAVLGAIITFVYLAITMRIASKTAHQRRLMSNADREEEAVKNDSITSYETVKYFNAEAFEFDRYRNAIKNFQTAEARVTWSVSLMNVNQSLVFMLGMLVAMMFGAYQVSLGQRRVGDFVTLLTLLNQLQGPLNFFGTFYRTVQQTMISGERLLELFKQRPTVVDRPGATEVRSCDGHVEFSKVEFAYDQRRIALSDLSFNCPPGTTTALVGESGGGKSTLFRLMYRYFNCQRGSIKIDGKDVKDVTIDSIRRFIGVVPQDTVLFNETLMYNLKYANQEATEEDIYAACQAASIHDRIMSFPDGYNTKVGERGLRLSGGEKQRVAIARTLIKDPKIIMLDEATSALDSHTEQEIQSRLAKIAEGRTLMIIAHRLSTITHADQILVLKNGTIVEKGTHQSLLSRPDSMYASMWNKQARAEKAAEDARNATQKAKKLLDEANIGGEGAKSPPRQGSDEGHSSSDDSSKPSKDRRIPNLQDLLAEGPEDHL